MSYLLHNLVQDAAEKNPSGIALSAGTQRIDYSTLSQQVQSVARLFLALELSRGDRIAVYLEKRIETVVACFGAACAGAVFVPVNPLLKAEQVGHILRDCNVRVLVTSGERLHAIASALLECPDLRAVVLVGTGDKSARPDVPQSIVPWNASERLDSRQPHRCIDTDMVAILYTSGSTGRPKGVVLSHRNMVAGARSVAEYIGNHSRDCILAALPLSFDAGFSQLTTAFVAGARVHLLNHLLPRDVVSACEKESVTGLTAVPPLWIQLSQLQWPEGARSSLRYFANTGGHMPKSVLDILRKQLPNARPFLMYGLTEAFRSTYLPPEEVDRRPDSIGKAIPNAEILVVREDGTLCGPGEPGELVHRGALVSLGYWNDPERTAERFKPAPAQPAGLVMPEMAVWSGDTVRMDAEGFLYFVARRDEMIKTSGYRVSPTEVEEVVYSTGLVGEVAALGIPHPALGQAIVVVVVPKAGGCIDRDAILLQCRERLPAFMVPAAVQIAESALPRNANGKIDRKAMAASLQTLFGVDRQ